MTKVLIAEDDAFLIKAYAAKLQKEGFEVFLAGNGQEAVDMARQKNPEIILLDMIMPVKTGFDALEDLKNDEELKKIPVVVLSNLGQEEDIDYAKKLGAVDYLVKSNISMKDVVEKIKKIVA